MEASELKKCIVGGETSRVQFKEDVTNAVSIAQEMVAFSNSKGGRILIGINDKTGAVTGLSFGDIQRINSLLGTAANEHVKSPIIVTTETVELEGKQVIVVDVPEGRDKPYMDKDGLVFVKNAADKRKVTSKEELSRLLQSSGNLYAEEVLVRHSTYDDLDWPKLKAFCEKKYKATVEDEERDRYIHNLRLGRDGKLNTAGALLFGKDQQYLLPQFFITAIWLPGNKLTEDAYKSSEDLTGTLPFQYQYAFDFVRSKLNYVQGDQGFNSLGIPEVPLVVFQELLVNALVHRDYFINDTIKLFVFRDRVEIRSPGKLPNNLTVEEMKLGLRKSRNFILYTIAPELLPYRGAGSGILRALEAYPDITFINDTEGEQFTAIIHRPYMEY